MLLRCRPPLAPTRPKVLGYRPGGVTFLRAAQQTIASEPAPLPMRGSDRMREDARVLSADPAEAPAAEEQTHVTPFSWTKQWYPVAVIENMDTRAPHPVTLMSVQLVVWRNPVTGTWACVEDRCPHRSAPLSQGQVVKTTGELRCAYHGWTFDQQGKCTNVPASANPERICNMRGSCALTRPVSEAFGLLWVWGESGPLAHIEAAAAKAPLADVEILTSPGWVQTLPWLMRMVPVTYESQLDNSFDPAHTPIVHHGRGGFKREAALRGFVMRDISDRRDLAAGVRFDTGAPAAGANTGNVYLEHIPPCGYNAVTTLRSGVVSVVTVLKTPVAPGYTLNFNTFIVHKPSAVLRFVFGLVPVFMQHLSMLRFSDMDFVIQHEQDRNIEAVGGWRKTFLIPDATDAGVKATRVWMDRVGPIPFKGGSKLPPRLPREQVIDHYSQHVAHCKHCQRGLATVRLVTVLAGLAAGLLAAAAAAQAPVAAVSPVAVPALPGVWGWVGAALLAWVSWAMYRYQSNFFYQDYDHRYT